MAGNIIQLISDALSIITISSCLILKVPQIMKLYSLKSAGGINLTGLALELFSYTTMFLYNFCMGYSLLSYMEYPIILVQELVLVFMVLMYKQLLGNLKILSCIVGYFCLLFGFLSQILPTSSLVYIVPLCTPISASSKLVFLYEILKTKNAEAISLLTWFISAFTNATRIFTIYVDSSDFNLLMNFGISTLLSSSILTAAWFFKNKTKIQ